MIVVKQLLRRQIHDWIDEISFFVNKFWSVFFILGTFPIYIWSHRKFFLLTFSIPLRMLKLDIGNFITFHNFPILKIEKAQLTIFKADNTYSIVVWWYLMMDNCNFWIHILTQKELFAENFESSISIKRWLLSFQYDRALHCTMLPLSTKSCLKSSKLRPILNGHAVMRFPKIFVLTCSDLSNHDKYCFLWFLNSIFG